MSHKIIAVTPAGRKAYLEILRSYILRDESIEEWHLWDNCRTQSDRKYIQELERQHTKIKVITALVVDGSNKAINQFYKYAADKNAFYIKMDDDIVYLPNNFGRALYEAAYSERNKYTYWSPLVVNNAICSWLLKYYSQLIIPTNLMASAACVHGWKSWRFAEALHRTFISLYRSEQINLLKVPNFDVSLARFSINCIGFFGQDVAALGEKFCPPDVDDEEWISAVLPSFTGRPGRIIGNLTVSHFSFFTQEKQLLQSGILEEYFDMAKVAHVPRPHTRIRQKVRGIIVLLRVLRRLFIGEPHYKILVRTI